MKVKIRTTRHKETLKCPLTQDELLKYAEQMADAQQDGNRLEDELACLKKEFQGKIDSKQGEAERLGGIIRAKYEHRPVDCEKQENFTDKIITILRLDTNAIVSSRAMTDDEAQQIPFDAIEVEDGSDDTTEKED